MTEPEAFLAQARSDFTVFELLAAQDRVDVPECHPLHYLQMATEKLAKAVRFSAGDQSDKYSHVAFSRMLHNLRRRDIAGKLGWDNWPKYRDFVTRTQPLFRQIDECNPAVGPNQSMDAVSKEHWNVEYPWFVKDSGGANLWIAPCQYNYGLIEKLRRHGDYATMLLLIQRMLDRFEAVFT